MGKRRAFTLIEILVVVSIIALLIAITMPSLSEARRISKKTKCLHNLHQIGVAMQAYLQVNKDTFPYLAQLPSLEKERAALDPTYQPLLSLSEGLSKELGPNSEVFECPADRNTQTTSSGRTAGKDRYFDSEQSSYEWWPQLNGLKLRIKSLSILSNLLNVPLRDMWMIQDYEAFHGGPDKHGSFNMLHADLQVRSK